MLETTRELEKRTESASRSAGVLLNSSPSVTSLLRSFSIKVRTAAVSDATYTREERGVDGSTDESFDHLHDVIVDVL